MTIKGCELKHWMYGWILLVALAAGCTEDESRPTGDTTPGGGGSAGSGSGEAQGGTAGGVLAPLDPPPAPPTTDVAQPTGAVTAPNLRVLPWAGFKAALTYSFDDTQPSQTEHWAELKATGMPMTFFCNPSSNWQAGFDANWTAVAAAGSEIGNHTWNHCTADLTTNCKTSLGTAELELDNTTEYIISHFGVTAVYSFASPYGDSSWSTYAAPRFLVGRGVMSGMVPPSGVTDWYNLPVFPVAAGQTATQFDGAIDSARNQGRWSIFMFHSILPTSNNWYAGVEIADITASVTYAASFGDVWMDTMGEVGAYARAQQMFEKLAPSANTWTWTLPTHFPPGKVLRVTVDGGTLSQGSAPLSWDSHGYYEVALDAGTLTWSP